MSGFIALIAWSVYAVICGNITVGVLAMFISLATSIGSRTRVLLTTVSSFMQITAPRIMEYKNFVKIDADSISEDEGKNIKLSHLPKIEFINVSFKYPNCESYEPSGGQWQKIGLARTFFRNASFIILDEPTSALDPETENIISSNLKTLLENKGALIISHRLSLISLVDKVIFLENGCVREIGTHMELMHKNGVYADMYRLQASKYIKQ